MSGKVDFIQNVVLLRDSETVVKFAENLELTCSRRTGDNWYNIINIKGDIEIKKIAVSYGKFVDVFCFKFNLKYFFDDGSYTDFEYKDNKGFLSYSASCFSTFYITATLKIKDVEEMKEMYAVPYQLHISSVRLQYLKLDHYFKEEFVLPGYDDLKFTYYAKKIKMSTENDIEVHVKNSYDVEIQDFDADTIQSAINFLHAKSHATNGKEMEVFKFAVKYGIQALNEACVSHFEESVDSKNVCEFIQIAYSNNLANLKQKCLQILVEKKKEIDSTKVAELPKNILFDVYCL